MANLLKNRWDKYTTTGNDGIIDYVLKTVGIQKGVFVEFGAADGVRGSNCRRLWEGGWSGLFIEANKEQYKLLEKTYRGCKGVYCHFGVVSTSGESLFDIIVDRYILGQPIDFCSIDIDGPDLEVFSTFSKYLPKVICIEGGQMLHPFHERVPENIANHNIQQSLKVICDVFAAKGYQVLCSYQDTFFVKNEFYSLFNVSMNLIELYFDGLAAIPHRLPFIQKCLLECGLRNKIVDDILAATKYKKYGWKKRKIWVEERKSQILKAITKHRKKSMGEVL